jgi:hypothetical protein
MNVHKNARLTPRGRERIVLQVESGQTPEGVAQRRFPGLRGSRDQKIHCRFQACSLPTIEVTRKQRLPQCARKWCFLRWSSTWGPPFLLVPCQGMPI